MGVEDYRVFADATGVWQQAASQEPFGILWDEIVEVSGYNIDGVTEIHTLVVLEYEYGEQFEFHDQQPGFEDTVAAMSDRLPGIDRGWLERVRAAGLDDPSVVVWSRPDRG